jgi:DNA-binding NarL/FixJ family response regulator
MHVLLVDDHAVVRRGLEEVLRECLSSVEVTQAITGQAAIDLANRGRYDLVLLDLNLPDMSGLEVLSHIARVSPHPPVLILSMHEEVQYAARAFRVGASGYLMKDHAIDELTMAVRKVLAGGTYVTPSLAEHLAMMLQTEAPVSLDRLSDREVTVLTLLAKGKTVTQIADHLAVSDKTVSTYRRRMLDKLKLHTTADLIRYALEQKLR